MKASILLLFALLPLVSLGQSIHFNIEGVIKKQDSLRYAYLVSAGDKDIFIRVPIVNGKFMFKDTINLEGRYIKYAFIFLEKRGNISLDEVKNKTKQRIWSVGLTPTLRSIILEDLMLLIDDGNLMNISKITKGGELTKQSDESTIYQKKRDYIGFIKKYPDSPLSLSLLEGVLRFINVPINGGMESAFGSTPSDMYNVLSERLKKTKIGVEIKKKIDDVEAN